MNIEEIKQIKEQLNENIDTLKKLKQKFSIDEMEINQNQEEIESINDSIDKYESEVEELKAKLSKKENYRKEKNGFDLTGKKVIESLLEESISLEREEIFKSSQLYRKQQEQQTKMLGIYNSEIVALRSEIKDIEARLNKDAIAKKNKIAKKLHLSNEEVEALENEKNRKLELIEMGSQVMEICADEIRRYGALINENNSRLNIIIKKEQRLSELLSSKENNEVEFDRYQMRLDKDELAKKLAGLEALKNRKEFLLYDPSEEIKKQIEQNEELLNNLKNVAKETKEDIKPEKTEESELEKKSKETGLEEVLPDSLFNQIDKNMEIESNEDEFEPELEEKDLSDKLFDEIDKDREIDYNEKSDSSEEKQEDTNEIVPVDNSPKELVEIIDAPESLKKQKLSEKFLNLWNKWRDKAIALALAAAMTVTASITMSKMGDDDFENIVPDQSATDITDLPQYNIGEDVDLTLTPQAPSLNEDVSESLTQNNNEEISNEQLNNDIEINNTEVPVPEMEQLVVEQPIVSEEPKVEKEEINNKAESVQPEIPEVEMEYPTVKPSEPEPEVKFEGIINNSEYETTILQSEGEFVEIPLSNGEVVFVQYGDNAENVPEEITVKYVGTDMYIYSPIVNTRVL